MQVMLSFLCMYSKHADRYWCSHFFVFFLSKYVQCNLDLVKLLVSSKIVTKSHNVTKSNDLCSKLKNGLRKIVTNLQVVTKFNVTKSRLHCTSQLHLYVSFRRTVVQLFESSIEIPTLCIYFNQSQDSSTL